MIPSRPPAETLRTLRELLETADFTEPGVCRRLDLDDIYAFQPAGPSRGEPEDLLDLLILLFLDGFSVDERAWERFVSPEARGALDELGLVARLEEARWHATVVLYPTGPLHVVSDSPVDPRTGGTRELPPDAVYPAVTDAARDFVTALPPSPRGRFLELCSGTGIGALLAASSVEHAWAVDITERSTRFAAFNAALNGLDNVTALEGDLYEPVEDLRFDTIVAHPPYMQSEEIREVYRDGGSDGEAVTRRILAGLGRHLVPGGRFHCTCLLTDREGEEMEDRIRGMLGGDAGDFDLLLMPIRSMDPRRAIFDEAVQGRATLEQSRRRDAIFRELGVRELVYCSLVLERHAEPREPETLRRPRGPATDGAAVEWFLGWERGPDPVSGPAALADARPRAPEHVEGRSTLVLKDGRWHPVEMTLRTSWPFPTSVRCAPWVMEMLARSDGTRTVSDVLASLRDDGLLSEEAPEPGLLEMVRSLVAAGLLTVPTHPPPSSIPPSQRR